MSDFEQVRRTAIDSRIKILPNGDLKLVFSGRRLPVIYKQNRRLQVLDMSNFRDRISMIENSDHI